MRKFVAGLVAGLVLASASVAGAYSSYWHQAGKSYSCQGYPGGTICKNVGFSVLLDEKGPTIYQGLGKHPKPVFTCEPYGGMYSCSDLRP